MRLALLSLLLCGFAQLAVAQPPPPPPPKGEVTEGATSHTAASLLALVQQAQVSLPASSGATYFGKMKDIPSTASKPVPVVIFLHGSSGLAPAIAEWQRWLAGMGIASVAPDSFVLAGRLTYKSPVDKATYERIHSLRGSEIEPILQALRGTAWADISRVALAGTSEGSPAVARNSNPAFSARLLFAWSCEDNYFVQAHQTAVVPKQPVLNIISSNDPFFSAANSWVGNDKPRGHCGELFKRPEDVVVGLANAPHTLFNLAASQHLVAGFLQNHFRLK
jgi:dienelactone hydrolase